MRPPGHDQVVLQSSIAFCISCLALSTALNKDDRPDRFPMVRKSSSRRPSFCTSKIFEDVLSHDEHRRKGDIGNALFIVHAGMLKVASRFSGMVWSTVTQRYHEIHRSFAQVDLGSMEVVPGNPSAWEDFFVTRLAVELARF